MRNNLFIIIFTLISHISGIAQDFSRLDVPYFIDNKLASIGFSGGLRSPQFSNIDLNGDGLLDLFVFDRTTENVYTFIKNGSGNLDFTYAPRYEAYFPKMIVFALLKDYNQDGIEDIFTSGNAYPQTVELWHGSRSPDGRLSFELVKFNNGAGNFLQVPAGSGYTGVYSSNIDLPAIDDIDGDGDIDLLSFEPDGTTVTYYENLQEDENLSKDTLKFKIGDICWGKFVENGLDDGIKLSNNPSSCASGITSGGNGGERHSGSAVTVFDEDGDGDMDIFIGDIGGNTITKLKNGGDPEYAFMVEVERGFPVANVSPEINIFLANYFVDINGDNKRDMIVTLNEKNGGENIDHVWAYTNVGTVTQAKFELATKNFLISDMAYFNSGTNPTFIDVNADGLQDLVIGTNGIQTKAPSKINKVVLLINNGTASAPSYRLESEDYLGYSQLPSLTLRLSPTAGDLDGDGDTDLLISDSRGQLTYFKNKAGINQIVDFEKEANYSDIIAGGNGCVAIYDLDKDGLNDIIMSESNNYLNFYKNIGTIGDPKFNSDQTMLPNTEELGKVFSSGNDPYTQQGDVLIFPINGVPHLMMSFIYGESRIYNNLNAADTTTFDLVSRNLGNIPFGYYPKFSLANLDGDPYYEMVVGNDAGGLRFYNTPWNPAPKSALNDIPSLLYKFYPNPASSYVYVETTPNAIITLFTLEGKALATLRPNEKNDISAFGTGVYMIKLQDKDSMAFAKCVIVR